MRRLAGPPHNTRRRYMSFSAGGKRSMDHDDRQIGRNLSHRKGLRLLGATGAVLLVGCGPSRTGSGAVTQAPATAAPTLNAEAQTAAALPENPTAVTAQEAEVATAEAATTAVASGNGAT